MVEGVGGGAVCLGGVVCVCGEQRGKLLTIPWETLGGRQGEGEQLATRCGWTD